MGCPYQRCLTCRPTSACARCGWNPPIHKERVAKLRQARGVEPVKQTVAAIRYFNTFGEEIIDPAPYRKPDFTKETGGDYPN